MTLSPVALFSEFNLRRRPRGFRRKALKPYGPAAAAALYQQAAVHPGHPASAAAAAAADAAALGLRHYELISAAAHAAATSPTGTPLSAQVQFRFDWALNKVYLLIEKRQSGPTPPPDST